MNSVVWLKRDLRLSDHRPLAEAAAGECLLLYVIEPSLRAAEDFDESHVRTMDMWGFTESQETVRVSPKMVGEFVFPYQRPLQERFGLNCYGCCEPLDKLCKDEEQRVRKIM